MAINSTTLAAPLAKNDAFAVLTAITGVVQGSLILIGNELTAAGGLLLGNQVQLRRGLDGSLVCAHAAGEAVQVGLASDFQGPLPGMDTVFGPGAQAAPPVGSVAYTASGAINPVPGLALLVGAGPLAMTLAAPPATMTGNLTIMSQTGAAHTVTVAGGLGGGGAASDVITLAAETSTIVLQAVNGKWNRITLGGAAAA